MCWCFIHYFYEYFAVTHDLCFHNITIYFITFCDISYILFSWNLHTLIDTSPAFCNTNPSFNSNFDPSLSFNAAITEQWLIAELAPRIISEHNLSPNKIWSNGYGVSPLKSKSADVSHKWGKFVPLATTFLDEAKFMNFIQVSLRISCTVSPLESCKKKNFMWEQ